MKFLDLIFIENEPINQDLFQNLFYSYDQLSCVGYNEKVIKKNKKYQSYNIIKEQFKPLNEGYKEYKAILELNDKVFVRIVINESNYISDILIYTITNPSEQEKYDKIFFKEEIVLPESLKNEENLILKLINNHAHIVKNGDAFLFNIGYEAWDYNNKLLNDLDLSITTPNFINTFKENKNFEGVFEFKKNNTELTKIYCTFEYIDGFYILKTNKKH